MSDRSTLTRSQWIVLAVALLLLNAALTFHNVWPTPWISPTMEMSVELGVVLLGIVAYAAWRGAVPRGVRVALAVLLFLLVLGRYVPGLRFVVNATMGLAKYPYRRFLLWSAIGGISWSIYTCALAYWIGTALAEYPIASIAISGLVTTGILGAAYFVYRRRS